jgi:hypothetical protein
MIRHRHLFCSCGLILLLFLFSIPLVQAQETGTVITKSGDKYENVVIKIHRTLGIISVERDTLKNIINFDEIVKILDSDGNDITAEIKKWHSSGVKRLWQSEGDWLLLQRRKQLWNAGIRLATNLGIPLGNHPEGIRSGIGYEGTAHFTILNGIALRISISKAGLKGGQSGIFSTGYQYSATRYRAGIQYHKRPSAMLPGKIIPYLYIEFGIVSSEIMSYGETKFAPDQGGGIIILISEIVGLDIGAEYNFAFGNGMIDDGGVFDFKLGLITFL